MPGEPRRLPPEASAGGGRGGSDYRGRKDGKAGAPVPDRRLLLLATGGLLLLAAMLLVGSYTFLPPLLGNLFGQSIKNGLGLRAAPEVDLRSEPPPRIFAGEFAEGQVVLNDGDFGGVRPQRVTIDLDPFELDVLGSVRGGQLASEEPLSGTLRMEVDEDEVARIARESTEDISIEGVELEKDRVTVESGAEVLGVDVPVAVRGGLEVRGQSLVFEPRRVSAFGISVPDRISERLLAQADFQYLLDDLPYDARISQVEVENGHLVLFGELRRIPLGGDSPDG